MGPQTAQEAVSPKKQKCPNAPRQCAEGRKMICVLAVALGSALAAQHTALSRMGPQAPPEPSSSSSCLLPRLLIFTHPPARPTHLM
jgi:hypothetical protein